MISHKIIYSIVAVLTFIFGAFIYKRPLQVFEVQKKLYSWFNWYIWPIDLEKEIRHTRIMGISLIVFIFLAGFYVFFGT